MTDDARAAVITSPLDPGKGADCKVSVCLSVGWFVYLHIYLEKRKPRDQISVYVALGHGSVLLFYL